VAKQLYSAEEVAEQLGLHVRTVRGYVRDGRLRAVRIGKQYRITREDIEAFVGSPVVDPPEAGRHRHVDVSRSTRSARRRPTASAPCSRPCALTPATSRST
jgi:excisionase family DNA binding protein